MVDNKNKILAVVKDYTVSNQTFGLLYNVNLDMLETFPKPNPNELQRYYESKNYISHTDSTTTMFDKLYQFVKNFTIKNKVGLINSLKTTQKNLLDIGAGTGDFCVAAQNQNWTTTAVEPNASAIQIIENKKVNYVKNTIDLQTNSYDCISMWHVLEHVSDLEAQFLELKRLLKRDGSIVIAVPNYKSYDAAHYGRFWAAFDVPRHLWHFSQNSIKRLAQKNGFTVVQILPMKLDSFYVSMLSEKYQFGKIKWLNAFYIAFKSNLKARKTGQYSSLIYVLKNQ